MKVETIEEVDDALLQIACTVRDLVNLPIIRHIQIEFLHGWTTDCKTIKAIAFRKL